MLAQFKTVSWMAAIVIAVGLSVPKEGFADNVLNGQHTANVQLVMDNTPNQEVFVEIHNTAVYFYAGGAFVPLVSTYNNTFASIDIEVVGGANGNSVVVNDHSTAYLAGVNVRFEFSGGNGNDSVQHGINYWSKLDDPSLITSFRCTLFGHGGMDNLDGANGNDVIYGDSGVGLLSGGAGNDVLVGGNSMDSIHGDDGNDTIIGNGGWNFLYGDDGNDTITGGNSFDNIYGGNGNDTIKGGGSNDNLFGDAGNDLIYGGSGADDIEGGDGDDVIKGESGLDEIFGGNGDDVMDGAGTQNFSWGFGLWYPTHHDSSNDIIEGGPGADWFKNYRHLKPNGLWAYIADQDTMVDYNPGEGDIATTANWKMTLLPIVFKGW